MFRSLLSYSRPVHISDSSIYKERYIISLLFKLHRCVESYAEFCHLVAEKNIIVIVVVMIKSNHRSSLPLR